MASQLFERFGDQAHLAVVLADREARALGHPLVDAEHLLAGCLHADAALAAKLVECGLTAEGIVSQLVALRGADSPLGRGDSAFTPAVTHALRGAAVHARRRDRLVTCTDLTVELVDTQPPGLWQLLARMTVDPAAIRRELVGQPQDRGPAPQGRLARVRRRMAGD